MIRLTYLLRRKPGLSLGAFQRCWLDQYGPRLASHAAALGMLRSVQVRTLDEPGNQRLGGTRGQMEPPYDGVLEAWWWCEDDLDRAVASREGQAALAELLEEERTFVDLPNSPLWLNYEYPQVNPPGEEIVARERSAVVKLFYVLRHLPNLTLQEAQAYWRTHHGPVIRFQAAASPILRYIQVHRCESPHEAAWREARGTQAEPYTGHAELWFERNRPTGAPEQAEASRRAEEDERHFIDFARSSMWWAKERVIVDRR